MKEKERKRSEKDAKIKERLVVAAEVMRTVAACVHCEIDCFMHAAYEQIGVG
jgi:hypothetical protein